MVASVVESCSWSREHSPRRAPVVPLAGQAATIPFETSCWSLSPALHFSTAFPNPSFWNALTCPRKPGSVKLEMMRVGTIAR